MPLSNALLSLSVAQHHINYFFLVTPSRCMSQPANR